MTNNFKVGDRVVIVKVWNRPYRLFQVATITKLDVFGQSQDWKGCPAAKNGMPACVLDIPPCPDFGEVAYPPSYLELYRDDGQEKFVWTDELRRLCKHRRVPA